jgi:hypothetical protein
MAFEHASVYNGNPPDSLLRYCLDSSAFEDRITALAAALDLLGDEGAAFCDYYLLGIDTPPLWGLKAYQPSSAEILEALNYIETLLASWRQEETPGFAAYILSEEELSEAIDKIEENSIPVFSAETDAEFKDYCPELYAIVKDYYRQAELRGFELDDMDLRSKMLGD